MKDKINDIKQAIISDRKECEEQYLEFNKNFQIFIKEMNDKLEEIKTNSSNFEKEYSNNVLDKFYQENNQEMNQLIDKINEVAKNISLKLGEEFDVFQQYFKESNESFKKELNNIQINFDNNYSSICREISETNAKQRLNEESVEVLLNEFVTNLDKELTAEREDRIREEDKMLNWLEKATSKLNVLSLI